MHNTKKYLHTFNSGLICANKAACQLLCSSLLLCFRELNHFLEISVRDPRKILWVSRNSKLDPRNLVLEPRKSKLKTRASKLDSRKLRGSRIEFRVETVNLHLNGTVQTKTSYHKRQVQKSDRINSDRQSGSDQLGSTRIDSDRLESRKKHKIELNIETITHLKVKFRSKMDQIKKDSRGFSVSCCVVKPPFCIL